MNTSTCKYKREDIETIRADILTFFGKLNLANFMIADLPIYSNIRPKQGQIVDHNSPKPVGLSSPTQKVLLYIIGSALSQIHVCLSHLNKLLNEYKPSKISYAPILPSSPCFHQTPISTLNWSTTCSLSDESVVFNKSSFNRHLEPDVDVDIPTQYSLSFRNHGFREGFGPEGFY